MLHPGTLPLCRAFEDAGLTTWLIGGQAVELLCGGDIRPHDDLDFLVRLADAPAAVQMLERLGFVHAHGSLEVGDVFYRRDDVLLDLVPIDDTGEPPCTLGELTALRWPPGFLSPHFVQGVRTLTPAMHIEMKRVVADFYGVALREKDRLDLSALNNLS